MEEVEGTGGIGDNEGVAARATYFIADLLELLEGRAIRRSIHPSPPEAGNKWPAYLDWLYADDESDSRRFPYDAVFFWLDQECPSCKAVMMTRWIEADR